MTFNHDSLLVTGDHLSICLASKITLKSQT
uniref:Uncharacterized protein n=1 Tax=Arundo donax TaxID=35708 RepID=A0A0A8YJP1_ARUDO